MIIQRGILNDYEMPVELRLPDRFPAVLLQP